MSDDVTAAPTIDGVDRLVRRASQLKTSTVWVMVFSCAVLLYTLTAQTSVTWQDSGTFQWRILAGDYRGTLGLAVAHPVLILMGQIAKLIPLGGLMWRLNSISAVGMAVALANFMALVTFLTNRRWIGVLLAAMLGVSHIAWWLATVTETYTWVVAGLTTELLLFVHLVRRPRLSTLAILAFVNGAGLCLHNFALLPLPVYAVTALLLALKKRLPLWALGMALLAYLAGAGAYIGMTIHMAVITGDPIAAIRSALFAEGYEAVANVSLITEYTKANAALAALSFTNAFLPLAILGWIRFRRILGGPMAAALGAITVIQILFIIRYNSPDQFTSMLPATMMVAIAAAVGASHLAGLSLNWKRGLIAACLLSILIMPIVYGTLPTIVRQVGVQVKRSRVLPYRDEIRYWITPWKQNENSAQLFAEAALTQAMPDGVILSEDTALYPLLITRELQPRFGKVWLQFGPSMLPPYDNDRTAFQNALGKRTLFIVSPEQRYVAMHHWGILRDAECVRPEGQSLYMVIWKTRD